MSLWIEVYVGSRHNRTKVAHCQAYNLTDLRDTSDYGFKSIEYGAPHLHIPESEVEGKIEGHNRNSTVWSLVEKIAKEAQDE